MNTKDLEAAVSARIRATIADILPEDEWCKLVAAEVDRFLKPQKQPDHYYRRDPPMVPSGLEQAVNKALNERVAEATKALLADPAWRAETGERIREALAEKSTGMVESIVAQALRSALSSIGQHVATPTPY